MAVWHYNMTLTVIIYNHKANSNDKQRNSDWFDIVYSYIVEIPVL